MMISSLPVSSPEFSPLLYDDVSLASTTKGTWQAPVKLQGLLPLVQL
jgi:hypothetical protein